MPLSLWVLSSLIGTVEVQVWAGIPILTPASPLDSMLAMPTNHECTYLHAFTYCTRTSCLFDHIWLQDEGRLGEFTHTSPQTEVVASGGGMDAL